MRKEKIISNPNNRRLHAERELRIKAAEAMLTDKPTIALHVTEHFKISFTAASLMLRDMEARGLAKSIYGREPFKSGRMKYYFSHKTPDSVIAEFKKLNQKQPRAGRKPREINPPPLIPEHIPREIAHWMGYTDIQPRKGEHYAERNIPQPLRKAENRGIGSGMAMMELAA
jgi:hypothetical protein